MPKKKRTLVKARKPRATTPVSARRRSNSSAGFCIVGIGASAGGFDALRNFFRAMPADSGLAFVVIQHLDPTHKSLAAELFGKQTAMRVVQAEDGMCVEPNRVYTIPSDKYLSIRRGVLHLSPPRHRRGLRLPIDHFFDSLGQDQRERAIGIILSGTGADGSVGAKTIIANGGVVLAQDPETAQFDSMPRAAIDTGLANHVLPVEKMPGTLLGYARHPYVAGAAHKAGKAAADTAGVAPILELIRVHRGYNFAGYRTSTLQRRILRRMGLAHIERMSDYCALLECTPAELDALLKDLLIGVTEFFRDPEAWQALQTQVIAPLVATRARLEPIRAWVPGCATGEEAYTLATLLLEATKAADKSCPVQVYATDTNEQALQFARAGTYPAGIAAHIAPERLQRFFVEGEDTHYYQVGRELREAVVFGSQNLLTDPPFSRLDLISCRNLLIYLEPAVQDKIIGVFNFSLRPDGCLMLGSAEMVGGRDDLFQPVSKKWRIFRHVAGAPREPLAMPVGDRRPHLTRMAEAQHAMAGGVQVSNVTQQMLLDRFAPAAVMVNGDYQAVYHCGPIDRFLTRPRGAPTHDLLAQVRDGLRARLRSALRDAAATAATVEIGDARMKRAGAWVPVKITVAPAPDGGRHGLLLLVVFEELPLPVMVAGARGAERVLVRQLEEELQATKDELQGAIERLEISNEELRTSNEEVVSTNEELQSVNEELESSKEELQSLNEELNTVNQQLQDKIAELETSNNDLQNLLESSEVATLCLDHDLRIKWFTPAMARLHRLVPSDMGRPVRDLALALDGSGFLEDAHEVLRKLVPVAKEFKAESGRHYLRRSLPYRTEGDQVSGVVITYTDITESKEIAQAVADSKKTHADSLVQQVKERTAQLRALTYALTVAEENERRNLAQNLHDDLGQVLTLAKLRLDTLDKSAPDALKAPVQEISTLLKQANRSVRSLAFHLSPPVLYELGLMAALDWLVDEMERLYGLHVSIRDSGAAKPLEQTVSTTLFRAVRELLINVARHAGTGAAEISVERLGRNLAIAVSDAGTGFDVAIVTAQAGTGGFGLVSINERMQVIGGKAEIHSIPGDGTQVTLIAPLQIEPGVGGDDNS